MWSAGLRLGRLAWWPEVFTQPKDSEGYPSGQRGQTVNLLAYAFGGSNPPPSTRFKRYKCFVEVDANHRNRNVGSTDSPGANRNATRSGAAPGGGGQDARSHPPPSTFTLESGGRPPSTGLHATEPDRLRQRTPLMRE